VLFPNSPRPLLWAANGLVYAATHFPNPALMLITAGAGAVWSYTYLRYRLLLPIAVSHAVLGATFYYWVYGRDLFEVWRGLVSR